MNSVHEATLNAEGIHENLCKRSKAVRGTRRIRDDIMLLVIVLIIVHANNDGDVFVLSRCRNKNLLGTSLNVLLSQVSIGEETGRFDNKLYAHFAPRNIERFAVAENTYLVTVNDDVVSLDFNIIVNTPVDRIVLKQMSICLGAAGIVDSNDIEGRILLHRAENKSADTTEAVDTNLGCHEAPLSCLI